MEITVKVLGLEELAVSMQQLAAAMRSVIVVRDEHPAQPQPAQVMAQPSATNPMPTQTGAGQSVPFAPPQAVPVPQTVPVTTIAQGYTKEQIIRGLVTARDMGLHDSVVQPIFAHFGITNANDIPENEYGVVAIKLRNAGVQI